MQSRQVEEHLRKKELGKEKEAFEMSQMYSNGRIGTDATGQEKKVNYDKKREGKPKKGRRIKKR